MIEQLDELLFAEGDNTEVGSGTTTPDASQNIDAISDHYKRYVVKEMKEEIAKQAEQVEQIQRAKDQPQAA